MRTLMLEKLVQTKAHSNVFSIKEKAHAKLTWYGAKRIRKASKNEKKGGGVEITSGQHMAKEC